MNSTTYFVLGLLGAGALGVLAGWVLRGLRTVPEEELQSVERQLETARSRVAELDRMIASAHDEAAKAKLDKEGLEARLASLRETGAGEDVAEEAMSEDGETGVDPERQAEILEGFLQNAPNEADGDDLQRIRGIGPVNQQKLYDVGLRTYRQIADLTDEEVKVVGEHIGAFPGRIEREGWVESAQKLVDDAEEAAEAKADTDDDERTSD